MKFIPLPCHETLRPFIRNYWILTAYCTAYGRQRIFSNGAASLQFYLTQPVQLDSGEENYHTVLFHQNMNTVDVVTVPGDFVIFGAEFVPFCSRVFFRSEKNGPYVTPEGLQDDEFAEVSKNIHNAGSTEERVAILDDFFMKRLSEFPAGDINIERLSDVFDNMIPAQGNATMPSPGYDGFSPADLASTACLSQKQFTRVFNKYVGMNPKAYLRLLRFHKTLQMLSDKRSQERYHLSTLTDIAWNCGYYDLAHMISDFRDICGYSPSELINSDVELTETFGQHFSGQMKKKILIENLI